MLARSNLSIGQVANACGFADPLYFSRRFRAVYGIPPSAYRSDGAAAEPPFLPGLPSLARRLASE
jgi:AraC family transcriptional regulator